MANRKVTVFASFGEVVFSPFPYQSFRIGPFSMSVEVLPGEDPEEVLERAQQLLTKHAKKEYQSSKEFWFREWKVGERGR